MRQGRCTYGAGGAFRCSGAVSAAEEFEDGPVFGSVHAHNAHAWSEWEREYLSYDIRGSKEEPSLRLDRVDAGRFLKQDPSSRPDAPTRASLIGAEPDWGPEALRARKGQAT